MTDKTHVSQAIRRLVSEAGEIPGSKLAMDLKAVVPDWSAADHGVRSLREFILTHVDGVVVAGRSGLDVLYRPTSASGESPGPAVKLASSGDVWRTWVSPSSPFALAFNLVDGRPTIVKRADDVPAGHVLVEPATVDEHRAIARDYLDRFSDPDRESLKRILESSEPLWWRSWSTEMEKLGESSAWSAFRHEGLSELLRTRLEAAGLHPTVRAAAAGAVVRGRAPRTRAPRKREPQAINGVRAVVASVLGMMSDEELRALRLPVGLVLDVLDEMKH